MLASPVDVVGYDGYDGYDDNDDDDDSAVEEEDEDVNDDDVDAWSFDGVAVPGSVFAPNAAAIATPTADAAAFNASCDVGSLGASDDDAAATPTPLPSSLLDGVAMGVAVAAVGV